MFTVWLETQTCVRGKLKYLGLTLDTKLSNTYYCQRYVRVDAYITYVRPILEYACSLCVVPTPFITLEAIQRWAVYYVMSN